MLSKASISACNIDHGARGARAISTILPVLLDKGITSSLVEVQTVSIVTVMKISENAGKLIAPHVHVIIPAFIAASANIEPKAFGQVTTMVRSVVVCSEIFQFPLKLQVTTVLVY